MSDLTTIFIVGQTLWDVFAVCFYSMLLLVMVTGAITFFSQGELR